MDIPFCDVCLSFLNQGWIPSCLLCHLYMMDSSVSPLSAPPAKLLFPITFSSHPYKCIAGTESTTCIYISRQKSTQKVNMSSRQGRRTIVGLFYESQVSCTCRIRHMGMKQQRKVGGRQRRNQDIITVCTKTCMLTTLFIQTCHGVNFHRSVWGRLFFTSNVWQERRFATGYNTHKN